MAISAMPTASGPPDAAWVAIATRVLFLNPSRKCAIRPVVPPIVVAAWFPAAIVVERPFTVGISRFAATGEPRIAGHLLVIATSAALEAAGTVHNIRMEGRGLRNLAGVTVLCRCRCIKTQGGGEHRSHDQRRVHVAAPFSSL